MKALKMLGVKIYKSNKAWYPQGKIYYNFYIKNI